MLEQLRYSASHVKRLAAMTTTSAQDNRSMALSNSSSLLVLQLIGAPGITPSRVRSIIEAAMKRNVRAADILTDKDQIRTLLTCSEIEKFYDFGNEAAARYQ